MLIKIKERVHSQIQNNPLCEEEILSDPVCFERSVGHPRLITSFTMRCHFLCFLEDSGSRGDGFMKGEALQSISFCFLYLSSKRCCISQPSSLCLSSLFKKMMFGLFCFMSNKFMFLMCFISERVHTVSQSERSLPVVCVVRRAFCHLLSCCYWTDECIKADLTVSRKIGAWTYEGRRVQSHFRVVCGSAKNERYDSTVKY